MIGKTNVSPRVKIEGALECPMKSTPPSSHPRRPHTFARRGNPKMRGRSPRVNFCVSVPDEGGGRRGWSDGRWWSTGATERPPPPRLSSSSVPTSTLFPKAIVWNPSLFNDIYLIPVMFIIFLRPFVRPSKQTENRLNYLPTSLVGAEGVHWPFQYGFPFNYFSLGLWNLPKFRSFEERIAKTAPEFQNNYQICPRIIK